MESLATVIAKIQKLRSLAKSDNPNEAANAAQAAAALIDKHQLTEADLQVKGEKQAEPIEIVSESLYESGRVMLWIHKLAQVLCEHYGCTYYVDTVEDFAKVAEKNPNARRTSFKAFRMVGRRSDADVVRYFFTWLQDEITHLTKTHAYGMGMKYSQNFARGCVSAIGVKLKEQHQTMVQEARATGQSQAMVLLDNRAKEASVYMNQKINLTSRPGSKLERDMNAFTHGVVVGKNIQLKQGLQGGKEPKKLK